MAQTPSSMPPLGAPAPAFLLPGLDGKLVSLDSFPGAQAYLVMFICNHCPFVKHIRDRLAEITREFTAKGVAVAAINANDAAKYPADSPEKMKEEAQAAGYSFPYLFDESQETAKAYRAACTPDFFLYDRNRRLAYRGRMDGARPGNNVPVTGDELKAAMEAVLAGLPPSPDQKPSLGCNIKWKPGNEPDYFK